MIAQDGYILPLVVIAAMILVVGAVILSARSFSGLIRSAKQKQRDEAIEIAETGASIIINELNSKFPYLLTISCLTQSTADGPECKNKTWEGFEFGILGRPASACQGRYKTLEERKSFIYSLNTELPKQNGTYRLISYEFLGDQIQGGTAIIQVEGQRKNSKIVASTAVIEKEMTIVPKYCNIAPFAENEESADFGLLSNLISLQKSSPSQQHANVIDQILNTTPSKANVHCNECTNAPEPNQVWDGVQCEGCRIDGDRSVSPPVPLPPAPKFNSNWNKEILNLPLMDGDINPSKWITYGSVTINQNNIIRKYPGVADVAHSLTKYCHTEKNTSPKITHCRMGKIELSGISLTIDPGDGDMRFYFEGEKVSISTDNVEIKSNKFGQVAFFGSNDTCKPDLFDISGSQSLGPVFIQMPCTKILLNGDGEIIGSVIANEWNSSGFDLVVPSDASQIMKEKYGISFEKDLDHEFVALGTNRWSLIQRQQ